MTTAQIWMASPPEVHSALLSSGPGPGPLLAAATEWSSLAATYAAVAAELGELLAAVQAGVWQGPGAEAFAAACVPYLAWLSQTSADCAATAARLQVVAAAYTAALLAMPTLAELAANHVIHVVLVATNFFGINSIPIAVNEGDYVRMWAQAATAMATYQAVSNSAVASTPQTAPAPRILKFDAQTQNSGNSTDPRGRDPVDDFIAEILKIITGGRVIWDPEAGTVNGLPYDAYTNPGTLMWWIARTLELVQDFQEFAKLLFTHPVQAFEFLVNLILFDWPTHILQLATWLAENPQLLAVALTPAVSGLGAVAGFAGLAGLTPAPAVLSAAAPAAALPAMLPVLGTAPTVTAPATGASSGAAPATSTGTVAPAPTSASVPPHAGGFPPYLVGGGPGIGFGSGISARAKTSEPASDAAAAVAAPRASAREQERRRRRKAAKARGYGDEFVDIDSGFGPEAPVPDDQQGAWASNRGGGALGFADTVGKGTVAAPAGLTTLAGHEFDGGPRMPMVPGTWDHDPT
ncbi:PPE family protein [Mycobacterium decipiens]|uniref:PPE family protein n=1 Tax=Mycobacterium decipiens TaxID=1430326 RepID=A0A1X2LZC6_9MYCO|nr:PPE family protein [Mycobacterium decipiens]OSC42647.1 hypothetical protein B8W66_03665 [Mycobacterium decipiens]